MAHSGGGKMALFSVTIVANSLEKATQLRDMNLDLHERAARRLPDTGGIAVPAILDDAGIQRVRAAGYQVDVLHDLDQTAIARTTEVDPGSNRFAPAARAAEADAGS